MGKTVVQRIWRDITELKILFDVNPHVSIDECKKVLSEIELKVKRLRRRELMARG